MNKNGLLLEYQMIFIFFLKYYNRYVHSISFRKRINPPPTRQISVLLQSPDIRNKYGTGKIVIDLGSRWKRLRVVGKIVHIVSDSSSTELKTTITFQADKKLAKKKNILPASTIGNECLMYDA